MTKKVEQLFTHYAWPGNVRELEYVIKGAMHILEGKTIRLTDLPKNMVQQPTLDQWSIKTEEMALMPTLEAVEKQMIEKTLERTQYNISQSAKQLGIPRQTLQYKIKKLGIQL